MTTVEIPDYEDLFAEAIKAFWDGRDSQAAKQIADGKLDAGTRGAVTGGKHLDAVAAVIGRVMVDAGLPAPSNMILPGYYRRSKNWDIVSMYGSSIAAIVELKSQIGSIGNNANNRIEEMVGQSADLWKAQREGLLGEPGPWFGYVIVVEDSPVSRHQAPEPKAPRRFPPDGIFAGTDYIARYAIALDRLRQEREIDQVCLVASSSDGSYWYPEPTMAFQTFAIGIHARALTLQSQLGGM